MSGSDLETEIVAARAAGTPVSSTESGLPVNPRSMISPRAMEDFLIAIHFGKNDLLTSCVRLAYRDLQRTVRGVSRYDKTGMPNRVRDLVTGAKQARTQAEFDQWHQAACQQLIEAFRNTGYQHFTVGHAQKWLNMTLKYMFVLGDRIAGYEHLFRYCHVPIDQFVMSIAVPLGLPKLPGTGAWSTLNDYGVYMQRQRWFRERFSKPPLVLEFELWLEYVRAAAAAARGA
jgi:hypothetical protein